VATASVSHRLPAVLRTILESRSLLIAAWAIIIIECVLAAYRLSPWIVGDSHHYLALAQNLTQGRYGSLTQAGFEPDVLRPPGYPIVLWFFLYVLGLPAWAVVAVQLACVCGAIYFIQRFLAARGINQTLFICFAAAYPFPLLYSASLLAESWAVVATTAAALLVAAANPRGYALAGAAAGVAALMRSDLLLLPLFMSAAIALHEWQLSPRLVAIRNATLPIVTAVLVLLPYASWNLINFGRPQPTPIAGAIGTSLYLSTWQSQMTWDDTMALIAGRTTTHVEQIGLGAGFRAIDREIGAPQNIQAFDPWAYPTNRLRIAAASAYQDAAIDRISADPANYGRHVLNNMWALWVTKRYPGLSDPLAIVLRASSWAVYLLGFAGMAAAVVSPRRWLLPRFLVPVVLYPAAIHLWLHTEARYTAATRLLLLMFAAAFVGWLIIKHERDATDAT
jgi:hypothetical protein